MTTASADELLQWFGADFVAYACNIDHADAVAVVGGNPDVGLSDQQRRALDALLEQASNFAAAQPGWRGWQAARALAIPQSPEEDSVAEDILRRVDQTVSAPDSEDPLATPVISLALRAFPALLIPRQISGGGHLPVSIGHREIDQTELERAFLQDPELGKLWDSDKSQNGLRVWTTSGGSGPVQLKALPMRLINGAYFGLWRKGPVEIQPFLLAVLENLDKVRRLVRGEELTTTALTGLSVVMPSGTTLQTPWGIVRPLTERDRWVLLDLDQEGHTLSRCVSLFESPVAHRWLVSEHVWPSGPDEWPDDFPRILKGRMYFHELRLFALAALLGIETERPAAPTSCWATSIDPFGAVVGGGSVTTLIRSMVRVAEDDIPKIEVWAERIARYDDPAIRIAVERTVSAASGRDSSVDEFIDAVIAWEVLFGSREGELTFRISAAMAILLEAPGTSREALQKELKMLYRTRSAIGHGGDWPTRREARDHRNRALQLTIDAFRALFRDRPGLISRKDRATLLILDAQPHGGDDQAERGS